MYSFLVDFLAVILPSLFYHIFWRNKQVINTPTKHRMLVLVSSVISIGICVHFQVNSGERFELGLQNIPLILGTLYGGYLVGALLLTAIVAYHLFQYGGFFPQHLFIDIFLWFGSLNIAPKFHRLTRMKKTYLMAGLSLVSSISVLTMLVLTTRISFSVLHVGVLYACMQFSTAIIAMLLIETIQDQQLHVGRVIDAKHGHMIGELAASIAHEIRNPLTAARGFAQILQHDVRNEKEQEYIEILLGELDRALHMTNEYLILAKPQSESLTVLDMTELLQSTVVVMNSYATLHNVELVVLLADSALVYSNQKRLEQVFVNLIKNAIEAMPDGGQVLISSVINTRRNHVAITVQDHGVGMEPEQLNKIGHPFYSTKAAGTGLGLTICYRIVQSFGGNITVSSKKLYGTKVIVTLPMASTVV